MTGATFTNSNDESILSTISLSDLSTIPVLAYVSPPKVSHCSEEIADPLRMHVSLRLPIARRDQRKPYSFHDDGTVLNKVYVAHGVESSRM